MTDPKNWPLVNVARMSAIRGRRHTVRYLEDQIVARNTLVLRGSGTAGRRMRLRAECIEIRRMADRRAKEDADG